MPSRPAVNVNNLKQTPIPVISRQMAIVNPDDGTITRAGQLLLQQLQAPEVTQGTHSGRPDASSVPDGALYVENDRSVLYYNYQGTWEYLAGTMWGTLNPDQRPTDLGVHDGGFDFRTTDQPPREFIWSQAVWVEVTPVRYGTHAARLAMTMANAGDQMLWVETDRGEVEYQNQGGTWHYVAGAMLGTLSPDQRPTGLGANDVGFRFQATDSTSAFYWSGSLWVNTTPQAATYQLTYGTGNQTLTTSPVALAGAVLTLARAGLYAIRAVFDLAVNGSGDYGQYLLGYLQAGGVLNNSQLGVYLSAAAPTSPNGGRITTAQEWSYTAPSSGQVVQLMVSKTGGTGTSACNAANSMISATWISP